MRTPKRKGPEPGIASGDRKDESTAMSSAPLTVSELSDVLKGTVNRLGTVEVVGEISGYKHYSS